jgi:hypothetical protein
MNSNNKYPEGSVVYALEAPGLKLRVRRFVDRIYYCQHADQAISKDVVYFERELTDKAG